MTVVLICNMYHNVSVCVWVCLLPQWDIVSYQQLYIYCCQLILSCHFNSLENNVLLVHSYHRFCSEFVSEFCFWILNAKISKQHYILHSSMLNQQTESECIRGWIDSSHVLSVKSQQRAIYYASQLYSPWLALSKSTSGFHMLTIKYVRLLCWTYCSDSCWNAEISKAIQQILIWEKFSSPTCYCWSCNA